MNYYCFKEYLSKTNRYILNCEAESFLQDIFELFANYKHTINPDKILYRAQKGCDWEPNYQYDDDGQAVYTDDHPVPYLEERMRPREKIAKEGRVNPKGISFLYLASDRDTAISEVRPWVGQKITVAKFNALQELNLIDFTKAELSVSEHWRLSFPFAMNSGSLQQQTISKEEKSQLIWHEINEAFSKPIELTDTIAEYAPTQLIAEFIKNKGFDGLIFKSSVGKGKNIVIFEQSKVEFTSAEVFVVKKLTVVSEPAHPMETLNKPQSQYGF